MIEPIECSWDKFITEATQPETGTSTPLFRGHRSHCWDLSTTLERIGRKEESLYKYYRSIQIAHKAIECCTKHRWKIPLELTEEELNPTSITPFYNLPAVEYMIYLRHHGFPSPLLDWSESPYVASFFAYTAAKPKDEYCSIYRYIEYPEGGKGGVSKATDPKILSIGPTVATHKRHFIQQS